MSLKPTFFRKFLFSALIVAFCTAFAFAQTTVSGTVTDASGEGLIGASVIVKGTSTGTTTDGDGKFNLSTSEATPFTLVISYTGFITQEMNITGNQSGLTVTLADDVIGVSEVVISASRKAEKVQDAPASIAVITPRKLATSANPVDPTRNLVNTAGVQIQQQSANRINISMRGGAGLFGTSVFPILDYRSLVGPGIGTFQSDQAGLSNIDLQRIEVVRGPGSALYGPGVTQGVVHFISKNPIDYPGTTIEAMGGTLNTIGGAVRHAGRSDNKKFGYKINAQYRRGNEFTLDPNNADDAAQIAKFIPNGGVFQPAVGPDGYVDVTLPPTQLLSFADLDSDGDGNPMQSFWNNAAINGTLEFRPQDDLNITVSGGFNSASSIFYNEQGEGLSQANEVWGQARMQKGGLFFQVFGVNNDGGTQDNPTFLYQTGNRTPVGRTQFESQLQYNFGVESFLNADFTVGFDYRFAGQDTENLVYGRNEQDDDFSVVGGYAQGKFELVEDKLDFVLAGRYDRFNFIDDGAFAPRAALVFKPDPRHTIRGTYNRSTSTVSNLQLNIDFPLSTIIPGSFDVWLYGNKTEQTFNNPRISWFNGLLPDVPVEFAGQAGLPLGVPFTLVNGLVVPQIVAFLNSDPNTQQLAPLVENVLNNGIDATTLGTTGVLSPGFNIFDGSPLGLINAPISAIATQDNWEIGYKGLIGDKLAVTVDIYNVTEKNNSQFTAISPAYILLGNDGMTPGDLSGLPGDLAGAVFGQAAPQIEAALIQNGMSQQDAQNTVQSLMPLIIGAYTAGGDGAINTPDPAFGGATLQQVFSALPFHATSPTDQVPPTGGTHLAAGYRTFDERSYWGSDIGVEYYINSDVSVFGNYSWVNANEFMQSVVGPDGEPIGSPLPTYLNIPKNKFRLGLIYAPSSGLRGSLAFQHDDSYFASAGQFSGNTTPRNLVDASVGYTFDNGLAIDFTATNLFNNKYRYLPNMPEIGFRGIGKVTYTFGTEDN